MKVLKKSDVVKMKQVEHTIDEKSILSTVNYPFLVNMLGSFQDSKNLYIVLEYISGGEMFTFLRRSGVRLFMEDSFKAVPESCRKVLCGRSDAGI